jgi:CRISPR/Cas system-associated exonuclease Cas4 (RecB family)
VSRLLVSWSQAELLRRARERLRTEVVVVAPTRGAADDFVRAACDGGFAGVHRLSLVRMAASIASGPMAAEGLAPVSGLGMEALAARVTHALHKDGKLDYFGPVARASGFPRALAATLSELRLEGVRPDDLKNGGVPGSDLARLLARYEAELAERKLADLATVLRLATEEARRGRHRLLGLPLVLLSVPAQTESQREFVAAAARRAPDVLATALAGDEEGVRALEQALGCAAERIGQESAGFRANLFEPRIEKRPEGGPDLQFFSAPGEGQECVEIARRIAGLASEGVAFDQAAILLRNPERYQPLVEEALRRAGIPGYFTRGSARPEPAGRAFLALLACAAEGCSATRFAEYLSLGQAPKVDERGAPVRAEARWVAPEDELLIALAGDAPAGEPAGAEEEVETEDAAAIGGTLQAPSGWEKLLVDAAVVGGRSRWERRLRGLEAEFRLQLAEPDLTEAERAHLERQIERLGHLERFALPLVAMLDALPRRAVWGEWLERLAELAGTALRRPEPVLAALAELEPMEEVGPVDLDEVAGALSERLRFLRTEPPARRYGQVFVATIEEARGRTFEAVFVPGLAEGLFPRRAMEDPLLLDAHRRNVKPGLAQLEDRSARERLLLRTAAAAARARLVVSYPRMDTAQGRPRVPSFYALETVRAAEGRLPELKDFERRAERAAPARLGWPAPAEAAQAIDDTEYDLATVHSALGLKGAPAQGSARYLMEVNPHLARSLRARWQRWEKKWSGADGVVAPQPALAQHRLHARSYSPPALQRFSACPYQFLLYAIHRLKPREEAVALQEMDPLTRGSLFHEAQFEILRKLEANRLLPLTPGKLKWFLQVVDEVVVRVAAKYEEELAPAIPKVWETSVADLRTDLRGWIREATAQSEWRPVRYEFGFGLSAGNAEGGRDPRSVADEAVIEGARLRGVVDLVERDEQRRRLRVTDHKTGKPPAQRPVYTGGGAVLQPLLYGLAVEQLLGEPVDCGRLYFCTQRGGYDEVPILLNSEARQRARIVIETIDRAIGDGFLPAAPAKEACELCDYRVVCGPYEELRVKRKGATRLEALQNIRRMP